MRLCLSILFTLLSSCVFAQERWAIVVGISDYPCESGWDDINGANDVSIIKPMLLNNGFQEQNIIVLTDAQATKSRIKAAFDDVAKRVSVGDTFYFHFSGHGQQVADVSGDEGVDPYDEALVAYDALRYGYKNYKGEYHIIDDELNAWLWNVRDGIGDKGKILVVLDTCFSCDGSRGDDEEYVRGATDKLMVSTKTVNHLQSTKNQLPINWVCISACDDTSKANYEYKVGDLYYGRLSYLLSRLQSMELSLPELQVLLEEGYKRINLETKLKQNLHIDLPNNNEDILYVL